MLKGNQEFVMIDDQKVVYEEILGLARQSQRDQKKRVIVILKCTKSASMYGFNDKGEVCPRISLITFVAIPDSSKLDARLPQRQPPVVML